MKRIVTIITTAIVAISATAQTYLNTLKPSSETQYTAFKTGQKMLMMGNITAANGFTLGRKGGYLVKPEKVGAAIFDIGGKYDKLTFVMGPMENGTYIGSAPSVVAVYGDGRKLLDEKIYDYSIPKGYMLDISGVKELKFDIVLGEAYVGFGAAKLYTAGQSAQVPELKATTPTKPMKLVSELKPFYTDRRITLVSPTEKVKSMKINAREYGSGLELHLNMPLSGSDEGSAMFNLKKRFDKLTFILGPVDNATNQEAGKAWVTVKADGKIIYEKELGQKNMAEQVTLDVSGVDLLSFLGEQAKWDIVAGFADITAYPKGMAPNDVDFARGAATSLPPTDPKLARLPNQCKLVSNIEPFTVLGPLSRDKAIYTGKSDYLTFSMGGVKYNEGLIFTSSANVMHDNVVSSYSYDLGNQFDYITFTAGYIGKSVNMKNDVINIYADDKLIYQVPIYATGIPSQHWVKIDKCRKLTIENKGGGGLSAGASGLADIVLYRGEIVDNDLFVHPKPNCPDEVNLVEFATPYIHYISTMNEHRDKIFYDGTTIRNYWPLRDGTRINNGFMLQTSVHFSLEHGVLADDPNAVAAVGAGAAALGASFIPVGAVGGTMVGTSFAGLAGMMLLAAGGQADESSCAAFNTWGEYNSVTFTVACISPADANLLEKGTFANREQRLLIGADGEVVAELLLNEMSEPTTFTVPINGCQQLMFWMPCDGDTSGKYIIYDAVLSKQKKELSRPAESVKSHSIVSTFEWENTPKPGEWKTPPTSIKALDDYFRGVSQLRNGTIAQWDKYQGYPKHELHTYYLRTANGQVCKATQLINNGGPNATRNATGVAAALGANFTDYNESLVELATSLRRDIEKLQQLNSSVNALRVQQASAALNLPSLGLGAVKYGKEMSKAKKMVDQCNKVIHTQLKYLQAQYATIAWILDHAVDIDGKQSTKMTVFTPLAPGEAAPAGEDLQLVETFVVK